MSILSAYAIGECGYPVSDSNRSYVAFQHAPSDVKLIDTVK
jgi:hypothetical protein